MQAASQSRIKLLAISGSLRQTSSNTTLLRALKLLASEDVVIDIYAGLDQLPHFNPELEDVECAAVADYCNQLQQADGLVISSPEYAHGVPGVLKNALDWVVGSGELVGKPVALLNASPRATHALASLHETLTVMMAKIVEEASITIPLMGAKLDAAELAAHPDFSAALQIALTRLVQAIDFSK
ncbi:MAG: NAD(P)H-dependent oxidoreductase [Cyanobacteria bacterium P01_A01_bin.17]